ncbi:uncharacterized protein J3D65DRAFT_644205 [Phyllosticta citribraziliensis]|uniref:Nitrogen regulatory protein areA GATA-like domain-containing protein n=1 Tax=Phyllosticta citribraziliensis TaxID=989973 RepID=A0ABR1M476_9PEZI
MAQVLPVHVSDGQSYFSPSPLRRSPASQTPFLVPSYSGRTCPPVAGPSEYTTPPIAPSSSPDSIADEDQDDGLSFPAYDDDISPMDRRNPFEQQGTDQKTKAQTSSDPATCRTDSVVSNTSTPEPLPNAEDDTAIKPEPTRHVDYLSHEWREEDIWSSWRHITSNRKTYGERSRLENASWRTWAKAKYRLRTVSPETLNCPLSHPVSEANSRLSKNNSFINKKPILKKRSMSEVMLQRSISNSSLLKQAASAVQAQQCGAPLLRAHERPSYVRANSDFVSSTPSKSTSRDATDYSTSRSTSGLHTPGDCERKHIRFDDKVEQCIAVDCKEGDDYDEEAWREQDGEDSSDEGLEMKTKPRRLSRNNSRTGSFGPENKTIAKLPDTTLKYRDSPEVPDQPVAHSLGFWRSSRLSPSSSQETIRPTQAANNFLLGDDDDDDDDDMSWEPSNAFVSRRDSVAVTHDRLSRPEDDEGEGSSGLRRTPSGMFMPYVEDEDDIVAAGLFGKVVDTVNTAKDIAHVIWNVGWRS